MAPIIPDTKLPRRSESGMQTRAVNAAAGVLLAAMQQGRQIPTSLAIALDSAGLLNSPEHAAEHEKLRTQFAEVAATVADLVLKRGKQMKVENALRDHIAELETGLAAKAQDAEAAVKGWGRARDRIAELEAAPTIVYRAEHPDSGITLGHYGTEAAAREHCETTERRSWPTETTLVFDWIEDDEDRVAELMVTAGQNEESTTGYLVTALEIPSEYDAEADE